MAIQRYAFFISCKAFSWTALVGRVEEHSAFVDDCDGAWFNPDHRVDFPFLETQERKKFWSRNKIHGENPFLIKSNIC